MPQTTSWYHEISLHFSSSPIKFAFWTVIHPMFHNGEHSCPCAWADGPVPPSGDSEHREPAFTSLLGTYPLVRCLIMWCRRVRWYPCWDMVGTWNCVSHLRGGNEELYGNGSRNRVADKGPSTCRACILPIHGSSQDRQVWHQAVSWRFLWFSRLLDCDLLSGMKNACKKRRVEGSARGRENTSCSDMAKQGERKTSQSELNRS